MKLIRWDPVIDLVTLQEKLNRLFESNLIKSRYDEEEPGSGVWAPPVDILETPESIVLIVELPGLDKKSIHVEVKENVITLKGERKFVKGIKEEQYHRIERYYGKFIRSFNLPSSVEKDKAEARFKDGILRVTLPKSQKIKPQQVTVEVH